MIYETLKMLNNDVDVWVDPSGRKASALRIQQEVRMLRRQHQSLLGKRVVLRCNDTLSAVRGMITLDGFCQEMVLIHPGTSDVDFSHLNSEFHSDAIMTDIDFQVMEKVNYHEVPHEQSLPITTTWIIPTSGTTKAPRLISHEFASLARTIKPPRQSVRPRWGLMYGITRFAGLQVFLQSLLGGGVLLIPPSDISFPDVIDYLVSNNCTALSATPTFWRKILMTPRAEYLRLQQITLGGEIADQSILDQVKDRFPHARIVHIYASTETGVGFTVKDGLSGFPYAWIANGTDNVRMKIRNDCLWLKISGVTSQNRVSSLVEVDNEGFLYTGDQVIIENDRVKFIGRINGTINVGGNKVSPEEVEQVILSHPGVAMASVYGVANPFSGQIVVAEVVLISNYLSVHNISIHHAEKEIRFFCCERLDLYKVPARVEFVENVNINESGKIVRRR